MTERLRQLDRRAETVGQRYRRQYDTRPPAWLRHGYLLAFLGPLTVPVSIATSRWMSVMIVASVVVLYCLTAVRWSSKHRVHVPSSAEARR